MKNKNDKIAQATRHLKKHYRGNLLFLALFFLLVLFQLLPFFGVGQSVSVTLERYAIMIPIIAIPLSLKYFAYRLKGVTRPAEAATAIKVYKSASYLRLYTLSTVTLAFIVLYGYSGNMNFFWFTVVLFVVFLYCTPSYQELDNMTKESEKEASEGSEGSEGSEASGAEHPGNEAGGEEYPEEGMTKRTHLQSNEEVEKEEEVSASNYIEERNEIVGK